MAAYTDEQIQEVCDAGYEIMGKFTEVQNCMFPSTVIIQGMKAGLTAEEIACNAYDAIIKLPVQQKHANAEYAPSMHNIAILMQNEIQKRIEAISTTATP